MKFSEQWLRKWADPQISSQVLCTQLTMAGLEVDSIDRVCPVSTDVVVVRVISVDAHPNKKGLKVCELDYGGTESTIVVSRADNIYPGLVTVFAKAGARTPNNVDIKSVKFNGIWSHGTLCSEQMLGLSNEAHQAIDIADTIPAGTTLNELLHPTDRLIELSITPNRGDCLSIRGIAREVAAINKCRLNEIDTVTIKPATQRVRHIEVKVSEACPRYLGRIIDNVDCARSAPFWLREKLRRSGVQSINAVVDITNYVMIELGQPLHVFDDNNVHGPITIRYPQAGEQFKLLNGTNCVPSPDTVLITDENGPIALAGIIGGLDSSVHSKSRNIFLECAYFSPAAIAGRARQYRLHTDSSYRFERGVDPQLQLRAIERATELIIAICSGDVGPVIEVKDDQNIPRPTPIRLRASQIPRVLGADTPSLQTMTTLERLGMQTRQNSDGWQVIPPSHRFDIQIEADLIEELARIQGYDNIAHTTPHMYLSIRPDNKLRSQILFTQSTLVQRGYQEAINFSFVDPKIQLLLGEVDGVIELANPIAPALSQMRVSLWPGLISAALYNLNRQQLRIRLFEVGCIFSDSAALLQSQHIGGIAIGSLYETQWGIDNNRPCDLYDIKADIDALLYGVTNQKLRYLASTHPLLHPGQTAQIYIGDILIGQCGRIAPGIGERLKLPRDCYLFELYIEKVANQSRPYIERPSRFPAIRRDLALVVNETIIAADILDFIKIQLAADLADLELFDIYRGKDIGVGKKSLALSLIFQRSSETLTDSEVQSNINKLLASLETKFSAKLRI